MKGSTLHRSGLTRENMGVLANLTHPEKRQTTRAQLNQYYKAAKSKELDILWGGVQKGMQKVHNATRSTQQKSPAAYLTIGFIAGVVFTLFMFSIVSIFTINPKTDSNLKSKTNVTVIGEDTMSENALETPVSEEKYVVKSGDTLNGIAYRFYGKYDEAKILEIQRINNITNPASIKIGQELTIPVSRER